jgi:hypothetical protein
MSALSETTEMPANLTELLPALLPILQRRIVDYHGMFSMPLIAEMWEETLHRSFEELGYKTTWKPDRSHTVGEDMRLENIMDSRISCKSGQFIAPRELKRDCVKISGSRSTRFISLEDKIKHFSNDHDDFYFCLAKNKKFNNKYKLLVFPSSLCKVDQLTWTESASGKEFKGTGPFIASIGKSMSAQLWTTIPLDYIPYQFEIDCSE